MQHDKIHSVFWHIGRITIIVPLVIVGLALVFKIDQVKKDKEFKERQTARPTVTVIPSKIPMPSLNQKRRGIDLTKSQVCTALGSGGAAATVYIVKNNIAAEFLTSNQASTVKVVVKDDCIYSWGETLSGSQICGVSNYMGILSTLSAAGMLDPATFMEMLNKFGGVQENLSAFKNIEPVCREQTVVDSVFTVDKRVKFVKKDLVKPTP